MARRRKTNGTVLAGAFVFLACPYFCMAFAIHGIESLLKAETQSEVVASAGLVLATSCLLLLGVILGIRQIRSHL